MKENITTRDITNIAAHLPHDKISITVRKTSLNSVACEGIGTVNVNDRDVLKAVKAFQVLLDLGI